MLSGTVETVKQLGTTRTPEKATCGSVLSSRWGSPQRSERLQDLRVVGSPKKTRDSTKWYSLNVWMQWAEQQKGRMIEAAEYEHLLLTNFAAMEPADMSFWLAKFVVETRKADGQPAVNTLYQMLWFSSFLEADRATINVLEDPTFARLRDTLDEGDESVWYTGGSPSRSSIGGDGADSVGQSTVR